MPNRTLLTTALTSLIGLLGCVESPVSAPPSNPAPAVPSGVATVRSVRADGSLLLSDGRAVSLQGVELPDEAVRFDGMGEGLRARVEEYLSPNAGKVWLTVDGKDPDGVTEGVALVRLQPDDDATTLNEDLLRAGLAVFSCRTAEVSRRDELFAASRTAQRLRAGWFGRGRARRLDRLVYLNGACMGLYHQIESHDYHRHLDELHQAGFRHVSLLFPVFLDKVDSVDIRRDLARTVTDARLIETIGYARHLGMSVMLLPIVLILEPGEDDWRGVLKPKDLGQWWRNYNRFLCHYLDIAESTGVDVVSLGSELGSLEGQTLRWKRLILNARGRYRGLLTYSANWDHGDVAEFFPALDAVGMTAYFSLTEKLNPTVEELVAAWRRVAKELEGLVKRHGRPLILTELGYASQDGINRDPWNYTMNTEQIDLQEQRDCFEAFLRVAPEMDFLKGAYFYDYYPDGGGQDWTYSPRGKPAMAQWVRWAQAK
ncbi:MAG: hypothetical protein VX951_09780 [Planctomycetota bacterium]|nr:hypothetical protein [Planctomycetota bacterium]